MGIEFSFILIDEEWNFATGAKGILGNDSLDGGMVEEHARIRSADKECVRLS